MSHAAFHAAARGHRRRSLHLLGVLAALFALVVGLVVVPAAPAQAAGTVALEKTVVEPVAGAPIGSGDVVTYELKVTCLSLESPCGQLTLADQLPPELEFVGASLPSADWTQSVAGQTVTITDPTFLDGETGVVVVRARLVSGLPPGTTVTNTSSATISDPAPGFPGTVTDDAPVTITEGLTPAWTVRKTRVTPSSEPRITNPATGQTEPVTYRLEVCSTSGFGNVDLEDVTVSDVLPANFNHTQSFFGLGWTAQLPFPSTTFTTPLISVDDLYSPADARTLTKCALVGDLTGTFSGVTTADTRTNTVNASGTFAGGLGPFGDSDATTTGFRAQVDGLEARKDTAASVNPGGPLTWSVSSEPADLAVTGFVMEDVLNTSRPLWPVASIRSGAWTPAGTSATVEARIGGVYQPLGTATGTNVTFSALTTGEPLAGQAIDAVRWTFAGTVAPAFRFTTVGQITQAVPADAATGTVRNCVDARATSTQNGAALTRQACRNVSIVPLSLTPNFTKAVTPQQPGVLRPGDLVNVTLSFNTAGPGNAGMTDPILTDLLPPELRFSGFDPTPPAPGVPTGSYTPGPIDTTQYRIVAETEDRGGRQLVRFRWIPNPDLPAPPTDPLVIPPPPSGAVSVTFVARVAPGTPRGTYTNTGGVSASDPPTSCPGGGSLVTDTADLAGRGPVPTCQRSATFSVVSAAIMDAEKYSLGDAALGNVDSTNLTADPSSCPVPDPAFDDPGYTRFPCVGQVLANGEFDFRVVLENTGNQPLRDYIAYDVLPYDGDTGVSQALAGTARATAWVPTLREPVSLVTIPEDPSVIVPADAVIEYSASTNPCRPEMAAGADADWQGAACVDDWSAALPGGAPENVRAWRLRVPFASAWQPAQRMVLDMRLQAPPDAQPGDITWNSVAHRSTDALTGSRLPTAEPRKVGIRVPASSLGGTAFRDVNRDGVIDPGDELLPGIVARLLDEDGNELATATTAADGSYVFPALNPGRYRVSFDQSTLPPGTAIVPPDGGEDDAIDSDVDPISGETPLIDLLPNTDDLTWNVGVRERQVSLTVAKSLVGELTESSGIYLISVDNTGPDPTGDPIRIVDTLPAGLTFAGAEGEAWECTASGSEVSCVASDVVAAGSSYPPLRILVDVTAAGGEVVTNTVAVFSSLESTTPDAEADAAATVVASPVPPTPPSPPALALGVTGGAIAGLMPGVAAIALGAALVLMSAVRRRGAARA